MSFLSKNHFKFFFAGWFLVNIIQAFFTELFHDEAYYWVYSQFFDWGYYDHPPMIAWMIKLGYAIFPNELGVRLLSIILNTVTILIIYDLTNKKNPFLFYAIALSIAVAHLGGMITVPDIPLIFFTALWFWVYRRFTDNDSWFNTFLLALSAALLMYSKYHGILVILFTVLSNIKLAATGKMYVAGLIGLLLFAPHLYWQWEHDFPSVQYHLYERNAPVYKFSFTTEYILGQLALMGPLLGWLFLWMNFKYKSQILTEKALQFSVWGFLIFFLFSSLKGRVEANWTLPALVGLMVISYQYIDSHRQYVKWVYRLLPATLLLVLFARIILIVEIPFAGKVAKHNEFHNNPEWVSEVNSIARGEHVVFINSYQSPSKFWFYNQQLSYSLNTLNYRRNNYNFWTIEDSLIGKPAYVFGSNKEAPFAGALQEKPDMGHYYTTDYFSFGRVQILLGRAPIVRDSIISVSGLFRSPQGYLFHFKNPKYKDAKILLGLKDETGKLSVVSNGYTVEHIEYSEQYFVISFELPNDLPKGKYFARLGIESAIEHHPSLNSTGYTIEIK
jgi:hypothetical protein